MTQPNIFQEIQEDIERQRMEDMWKRYGKWVVACAVLIVLMTAGVTLYHSWRTHRSEVASAGLNNILSAVEPDGKKEIANLETFAQQNSGIAQATFARFHAASLAMKQNDVAKAIEIYDGIAADGKSDIAFRQLADLYAVQIQMDTADPVTLQKRLQPLRADNGAWRIRAMELDGYLALRAGDKAKAKQVFGEVSRDPDTPPAAATRANDMLRYIGE